MDEFEYKDIEETITLKSTNPDKKDIECDIIFKLKSKEYNKTYVVYTDNYADENNRLRIFTSILEDNNGTKKLKDIETQEEYKYIADKMVIFIKSLKESISKEDLEKSIGDEK